MSAIFFTPPLSTVSFTETATAISELRQTHAHFLKTGLIHDPFSAGRLISTASASPQTLSYAHSIFTHLQEPNSFSYNTLIRAYANSPTPDISFHLFSNMLFDYGVDPDNYTYTFVLKACSLVKNIDFGKQVHGHVIKSGFDDNVYICNTLIHMYGKCRLFDTARKLLDKMPDRNVISWNAILSAYVDTGMIELARGVFDEMPERNIESGNFMMSGYVKDELVVEARRVFDEMPVKDTSSWNVIITGYAHDGQFDEVFRLFEDMQDVNLNPDDYTLVNVLSCCDNVSGLHQGEWIHAYIDKNDIQVTGCLATALVDMYSKCGCLEKAMEVFLKTLNRDLSTWNSMINGLGIHGYGESALELFHELLAHDLKPDEVTFVSVLSACCRSGLVDEGCKMFDLMVHSYGMKPTIEHYGCMVDLFSRWCGLLNEAEKVANEVPFKDSQIVWESLLSACRRHNDTEMAVRVTKKLIELDPHNCSGYVYLSNVHDPGCSKVVS